MISLQNISNLQQGLYTFSSLFNQVLVDFLQNALPDFLLKAIASILTVLEVFSIGALIGYVFNHLDESRWGISSRDMGPLGKKRPKIPRRRRAHMWLRYRTRSYLFAHAICLAIYTFLLINVQARDTWYDTLSGSDLHSKAQNISRSKWGIAAIGTLAVFFLVVWLVKFMGKHINMSYSVKRYLCDRILDRIIFWKKVPYTYPDDLQALSVQAAKEENARTAYNIWKELWPVLEHKIYKYARRNRRRIRKMYGGEIENGDYTPLMVAYTATEDLCCRLLENGKGRQEFLSDVITDMFRTMLNWGPDDNQAAHTVTKSGAFVLPNKCGLLVRKYVKYNYRKRTPTTYILPKKRTGYNVPLQILIGFVCGLLRLDDPLTFTWLNKIVMDILVNQRDEETNPKPFFLTDEDYKTFLWCFCIAFELLFLEQQIIYANRMRELLSHIVGYLSTPEEIKAPFQEFIDSNRFVRHSRFITMLKDQYDYIGWKGRKYDTQYYHSIIVYLIGDMARYHARHTPISIPDLTDEKINERVKSLPPDEANHLTEEEKIKIVKKKAINEFEQEKLKHLRLSSERYMTKMFRMLYGG